MINFIIILYFFIFVLISTYFLLKSIIILTRKIFIHGSSQSQRESYKAFSFVRGAQKKLAGASAPWSRRRPKRASTFSLVKRFFFLREKEMVQTPYYVIIKFFIWGHIQSKYMVYIILYGLYNILYPLLYSGYIF